MARAFRSHSALGPERVQALNLKSVHRFMLLAHMQTHTHRFPLSSQQEFSKSSRHWKFGDWCQPHSRQSVPGTSEIAASAPNRSPQLPEVQAWTTRDAAEQIWEAPHRKQPTGKQMGPRRSGDVTRCHGARDELWTSRGWAHLAPGGSGQQERGSPGTLAGGIQPTPALWEMPGTRVRLRARRRAQ